MRRVLALMVVALPVLGTAGGIVANELALRDATIWRIPITGYDPRDPLRGRYIAFNYDWRARGDSRLCQGGNTCRLCLEDGGRQVLIAAKDVACAAPVDVAASGLSIPVWAAQAPGRLSVGTRLWVSEARAPELERQLRDRPMVAVARLTRGGRLIAERLEPRP